MADADSEVNVLRDQIKQLRAQLDASQTRCLELEQLLKESEPIPDDTQLSQSVTCTTLVDDVEIELPNRTDSVPSEIPEECVELTEDKSNDVLGATDETDSVPQQEQVDDIQDPSTNLDASPPPAPSESSPLSNTNPTVPLHGELDEQAGITSDQNDEANSPALLLEFTEDSPYFQEEITESTERMQLLAKTLKSVSAAAREWETASIALAFAESRLGNAFRAVHHVAPGTVVSRSAELLGSAFHEVSQAREVNVDAFSGSFTNRVESFTKQEVQVCAEFHKKFLKVKSNYNHALVQKVATGTKLTNKLASATAKSVPEAKVALENIRQQVLDVDSQVKISHLEYELARYDLVVRLNRVAIKMDFELAEGLIAGAYSLLGFFHRCDDELSVTKECLSEFEGMLQPGRDAFLESVGTANRTREQLIELGNKLTSSLRDFSGQKTGEVGNQVRKLYSILEDEDQLASFSTWMLNHKGAHLPVVCVIECLALLENALHRSVSQPNIVGDQLPAVLSEDSKLAMHNLIRAITEACADDCPPPELSLQAGAGDSIAFHFWHEFANVMSTTRVSNFLDKELREMVGKVEVFFALLVPQFEVWLAGTNGAGCNENVTGIPVNTDDSNILGLLEQVYAPRNKLNPRARSIALQSNGKLMRRRISFENPSSTTNKPNNEDVIPATTQHTPIKHSIRSRLKLWAQGTKSKLSQSEPPKIVSTQQDKEEDNNDSRRDSDGLQIMNTAELLMREPSEIVHQGYLFKLSTGIKKDWKRRWFILYPDVLLYIRDSSQFGQPVPVCNCMVLTVRDGLMEQSASSGTSFEPEACGVFAFEVLSPYSPRAYLLAAETSSEKQAWMEALRDCTAQMLNDFSRSQTTSSTGDQGSSQNDQQGNPIVSTSATPTTVATSRQSSVTTDGDNGTVIKQDGCCADCGSSDGSWASINLGIRLCIECSGVHRSLGVHVSKVRSVELDRWTGVQKDLLCALGNELANSVWEEDLDCQEGWSKPRPTDPREVKERFILAKYKWHGFIRSGQGQVVESELKAMYSHPKHKVTEFGEGSHPEDDAGHCGCELTLERLLFHGASENNLPLVYFCVVHKAKVTWQHPDTAETAVHVAARYGYALCCEYLCLNGGGACLQMRDCSDARPIDVAVLSNHAEVADILMDR